MLSATALGTVVRAPLRRLTRIGVQLYTVRHALARDPSATLQGIAAIGYREVELAGYAGLTPDGLRLLLDRHELAAPAGHYSKGDLVARAAGVFAAARTLGHTWVIVPWIPPDERRDLDGWRRVADDLNRIGARARDEGLRLAYHNQDVDFRPVGKTVPYDVLLEATDPELVDLEIDLYWVARGGQDPATYLRRSAGRTRLVHVKDTAGPPDHRMVDVGAGSLDWRQLLRAACDAGVPHYIVEHDEPSDPLAFCRASYRYLTRLEF